MPITSLIVMASLGGDLTHPAAAAVAALHAAVDELAAAALWSLPSPELARLAVAVEQVARRLAFVQVELAGELNTRPPGDLDGATSGQAFLKLACDVAVRETRDRLQLHTALGAHPAVGAALASGTISRDAAAAVCHAVDTLPAAVPAALTGPVEALLVDIAQTDGTRAVLTRAMEISHRFAPDALERDEAAAAENNALHLNLRHDGRLGLRGVLDKETGALTLAVLGPLAAPRPVDADGIPDLRTAPRRYADAFTDLLQLTTTHPKLPAARGDRPTLLVNLSLDTLRADLTTAGGLPPGRLDTGAPLSAGATRRLGCDARIIPTVLGGHSELLDVGRSTYTVPAGIRRALLARDQGCAFPGCERPTGWCDAHHITHWADGGATALHNLVLLCGAHHRAVHHDHWNIHIPDDGKPWFTPPPTIDPDRKPRQHNRYRTRELRL